MVFLFIKTQTTAQKLSWNLLYLQNFQHDYGIQKDSFKIKRRSINGR